MSRLARFRRSIGSPSPFRQNRSKFATDVPSAGPASPRGWLLGKLYTTLDDVQGITRKPVTYASNRARRQKGPYRQIRTKPAVKGPLRRLVARIEPGVGRDLSYNGDLE